MSPIKRNWVFSFLWINFAVVLVVLLLIAGNQISSGRELLHLLIFSLFYANLTGILGVLILGGLAGKLLRHPPRIPLMALALLVIAPLGCLLAETVQMLIGFVAPRQFWPEYLHTLRIAMPLAIVFGTGAMVHASLRGRVQTMQEHLREKEIAEERARPGGRSAPAFSRSPDPSPLSVQHAELDQLADRRESNSRRTYRGTPCILTARLT